MTKREITSLSLTLMGFYLLGTQLPFFGLTVVGSLQHGRIVTCVPAVIALGFAIFLIACSKRIAQWTCLQPETNDTTEQHSTSAPAIQTIAFSIVGLLIVAQALPALAGIISINILTEAGRMTALRYLGPMLEVLTGGLIFFNSRRLTVFWTRFNR